MATYGVRQRKPIQWKRIALLAIAFVAGFKVIGALAADCETPNSSNCTYRQEIGPNWTDITAFGHYLRFYWPHLDNEVPE